VLKFRFNNLDLEITESDVINPQDYPINESGKKLWIWTDHGFTVAAVIAETFTEAMDLLAKTELLDSFRVPIEIAVQAVRGRYSNGKAFDFDPITLYVVDYLPPFNVCQYISETSPNLERGTGISCYERVKKHYEV